MLCCEIVLVTDDLLNCCHVCVICYVVPSEVKSLSVIALSNSSVYVAWTQPLQPNGVLTGWLHATLLMLVTACWWHSD